MALCLTNFSGLFYWFETRIDVGLSVNAYCLLPRTLLFLLCNNTKVHMIREANIFYYLCYYELTLMPYIPYLMKMNFSQSDWFGYSVSLYRLASKLLCISLC